MFSGSPAALFVGVVFSALGAGYLMYAKRAASVPVLVCGVILLLFPMFVSSLWVLVVFGMVIAALPVTGAHFGWW
ncbi:MAG TPA: hypothetical protein VFQ88_15650 [Nevskiaceae bacterium]|nr:hypothetical protein [Nevskiaceae bacterium]